LKKTDIKNIFIGDIDQSSIIGTSSFVSKSILENETWIDNPVKIIWKINDN